MTIHITIPITREIIDAAQQRSSSHCMIADALKAARPDLTHVAVDLQCIRFTDPKRAKRYVYLTPPPAQRALINFDQGLPSEPMTILLRKPSQIMKAKIRANAPKNADGTPRMITRADGTRDAASPRQGPKHVNARGIVIGGTPPPNAVLSNNRGRVRAFGLSQLQH
jgi:hypothetical protein